MERRQLVTSRGRRKAGGFKISKTRGWEQQRFNVYGLDSADNEKNRRVIVLMNRTTPVA